MSAFRRAGEAYTLFQQLGRTFAARWPYVVAAEALALAGQADRAAETLAALDALGLPTMLLNEPELLQARAWTAAAGGDLPAARHQLEAAADLGEEIGDLIGAVSALHSLARLGRASHVAARLAALADHVDGDLVATRAAYANAPQPATAKHSPRPPTTSKTSARTSTPPKPTPKPPSCSATPANPATAPPPNSTRRASWAAAKGRPHPPSERSPPGYGSPPASSTPPCKPLPVAPTNRSPATGISLCAPSKATSNGPT